MAARACAGRVDEDKDQTYFLYGLRADQLEHARFPLGELTKPEVRAIARSLGLATADKPESQEICFVPGGDYRDALRTRAGWTPEAGPLVDVDGTTVGAHGGTAAYTVGQRQGLGVALGEPRYVSRIDPLTNTIQLGRREDLETRTFTLERASFVAGPPDAAPFRASVRIRHRATPVPATVDVARRASLAGDHRHPGVGGRTRAGSRALRRRRGARGRAHRAAGRSRRRCLRRRRRGRRGHGPGAGPRMSIEPSLVLSVLVGIFNAALYVFIRGTAGGRLPAIVGAAILGAWAGDAIMGRLGLDILTVGDYHLLGASLLAWAGIALVSVVATLGITRPTLRS